MGAEMSKDSEIRRSGAAAFWSQTGEWVFGRLLHHADLDLGPSSAIHQLCDLGKLFALSEFEVPYL